MKVIKGTSVLKTRKTNKQGERHAQKIKKQTKQRELYLPVIRKFYLYLLKEDLLYKLMLN